MTHRLIVGTGAAASVAVLLTATAIGQSPPRTSWGDPDLRGVFTFATITPLQRPDDVGEFLTDEEARSFEETTVRGRVDRPPPPGSTGSYNRFWVDYGTRVVDTNRTSLITDAGGKLPPFAPRAAERYAARQTAGPQPPRGPEDTPVYERCIVGLNAGPPFVPSAYNNTVQLFQTPDYVVIFNEMNHHARIVPLDGRPHLSAEMRQWLGDSRGWWDNDTLVVETTNFHSSRELRSRGLQWEYTNVGAAETTERLVERFTRVDADRVTYEFTLDDPGTWMGPWSAAFSLTEIDEGLFEYACHEGNYGMTNMLRAARAQDGQQ